MKLFFIVLGAISFVSALCWAIITIAESKNADVVAISLTVLICGLCITNDPTK